MKTVFGLILGLLLVSCGGEDAPKQTAFKETVAVSAVKIAAQSVGASSSYSGTVEPLERVRLSTRLSGWVDAIYAKEGQSVQQGAILLKLQNADLQAKLAQAEAGIAAADAQYENAKKNLARIEALFASKAATSKELDDMRTAFTAAESQKNAAHQQKEEVEEMLRYSQLRAPFSGVLTRRMIEPGDLANPGMPLLEVENLDKVKIVAKVPENVIGSLEKGMAVNVSIGANERESGYRNLTGTIDQILPSADPMSRQFEIKVIMDNPGHDIKSGVFARISLSKSTDETLLVPTSAIFKRGQLEGVFVIDSESKARLRWVRTGRKYDNNVEVLSGVNPGDVIVTDLNPQLLDGQPVDVQLKNSPVSNAKNTEVNG